MTAEATVMDAVKRLRQFLESQGLLGQIASNLIFIVKTQRTNCGSNICYEIIARVPELDVNGKITVRTYKYTVDVVSGDVKVTPFEDQHNA